VISVATIISYLTGPVSAMTLRRTAPELHRPLRIAGLPLLAGVAFIMATELLYWAKWPLTGEIILLMVVALPVYFYFQTLADDFFRPFERIVLLFGSIAPTLLLACLALGTYLYLPTSDALAKALIVAAFLYAWAMFSIVIPAFRMRADASIMGVFKRHLSGAWWIVVYLPVLALVSWAGSVEFGGKGYLPYGVDLAVVAAIGLVFYVWGVKAGWRTPSIEAMREETP